MSTSRQWALAQQGELQIVNQQRNYLRNPLPPGLGICAVCRSTASSGYELCYQCSLHRSASGGMQADIVAPIAYSIKGDQHDHNLIVYKTPRPSSVAMSNLSALATLYLAYHRDCFVAALGGPLTHVATVPSTRGRLGEHPLETIITRRIPLPVVRATANPAYDADDRRFYLDRFHLPHGTVRGGRILVIDDTWTTGSRVQALAFALKTAGARAVAAVVIGRRVNPDYAPSKPLVDRLRKAPWFDPTRCVLD